MDAEEQEPETGQRIADAAQRLRFLEHQNDAQRDHRHCVGRDVDLETKSGDQPGPGRRSDIRSKDDPDAADQRNQPGAQKRNGDD